MHIFKKLLLLALPTALLLTGCDLQSTLTDHESDGSLGGMSADGPTEKDPVIGGSTVAYDITRTVVDGNTIFTYSLQSTGESWNDLFIELAACEFVSASPNAAVTNFRFGSESVAGVLWSQAVPNSSAQNPRTFTLVVAGNVPEGSVQARVRKGNVRQDGFILSADCRTQFTASGTVYGDDNSNGSLNAGEFGLPGVVVKAYRNGDFVGQTETDEDGAYSFSFGQGSYSFSVPVTETTNTLLSVFVAKQEPSDPVSLTGNTTGLDFGFVMNTQALFEAFANGDVTTDGRSAQYWFKQINQARLESSGDVDYTRDQILRYLYRIEFEFLSSGPFFFGTGDQARLDAAHHYINRPSAKADGGVEYLLRELLAAQLNVLAGFGTQSALDQALLAYAEWVAANLNGGSSTGGDGSIMSSSFDTQSTGDALWGFNGSGGGVGGWD
jgi:hypothetical protein